MLKNFLQGRFMNHPLHPLLVHLPVGLWTASLVFDITYLINGNAGFASASYFCIALGILGALVAAPTGIAEYVDIPTDTQVKRLATTHMALNFLVVALYAINFFVRRNMIGGVPDTVTVGHLLFSAVTFLILGYSGYLGGQMVFAYGVGHRRPEENRIRNDESRAA